MRAHSHLLLSLSVAVLFWGAMCAQTHAGEVLPGLEALPEVVAEVNGKPIFREALIREMLGTSTPEAMDRIVRRLLVEEEAQAQKVVVSAEDVEREYEFDKRELMAELIRAMPRWEEQHQHFPMNELIKARFRMNEDEYKQKVVRERLLVRRCLTQNLDTSEERLREFFNAYPALFQPPTEYHASHILITPLNLWDLNASLSNKSPLGKAQALKKLIERERNEGVKLPLSEELKELDAAFEKSRREAGELLRKIREGVITWEQAIRERQSRAWDHPWRDPETGKMLPNLRVRMGRAPGDLGWFNKNGPLVKEFYEGAKDLRKGEIGGPILTQFGYHLVKMLDIRTPGSVSFQECKQKVLRHYVENHIQIVAEDWLRDITARAEIQQKRALLWPPRPKSVTALGPDTRPEIAVEEERDPVIGSVNGTPIRRSEVWRELVQSDAVEALTRLTNMEVIMSVLKDRGPERLEWEIASPERRARTAPPRRPIQISSEQVDLELNKDRLDLDRYNESRRNQRDAEGRLAPLPELTFAEYMYELHGQTEAEYRRSIEATLLVSEAIRQRLQLDDKTLQVQFALGREAYDDPAAFELSHILLAAPAGGMHRADFATKQKLREEANQIAKMYRDDPSTFPQLVQAFSKDSEENKKAEGKLGLCYPTGLADKNGLPPIQDPTLGRLPSVGAVLYAEVLKENYGPGQISTPIATMRGFHLVRVDKVRPQRRAIFDLVKDRVKRDYVAERAKMFLDVWLRGLKKVALVKNYIEPAESNDEMPPVDQQLLPENN